MAKIARSWIVLAGVAVLVLIIAIAAPHLLNVDTYRGRIEKALSDSLGRPVLLGHLSFSLFSRSLLAESPSIADDPAFSNQPFLTAKDVRIGVQMVPLILQRQLHITGFTIDEPKIVLVRAANGTWNYSSLGSEGKRNAPTPENADLMPNLKVGKIDITNGTVTVGTLPQQGTPHVYSDLNISLQSFSFGSAFPFTVSGKLAGGGSLEINGNAGPIDAHDASLTPLTAQVALQHADMVAAGFVEPGQGVSGIADLDAKLVSSGQTAQADGKLQITQLKLTKNGAASPKPVDTQFSVSQDLQSLSGKIATANMQIGKASIAVTGTYETKGNTTTTQMHVDGKNMPIDDLVAFLPSLGVQLPPGSRFQGGTLTAALDIAGPVKAPVVTGPVRVANTQLAGYDLGQKLAGIGPLIGAKTGSNTAIQTLSTDLRYGPEGTQTNNLEAVVTGLGSASGSGSISPGNALNYHLSIKLDLTGTGGGSNPATQTVRLLSGAIGTVVNKATAGGIPVAIAGTTANPTFAPDAGRIFSGKSPHTDASPQKSAQPKSLGKTLGGLLHH